MSDDFYSDTCSVCGYEGEFKKNNPSFREGYQCPSCYSSLRYRGQAESIIKLFGSYSNLTELAKSPEFSKLHIYEPGTMGSFRGLLSGLDNYKNSFYQDDVPLGDSKDGVECQSLEALTYDDNSIDLIISSDIMEHVRHPWVAFKDMFRVLKPGGSHVFSIPVILPMPAKTQYRVDTSTDEDIHLKEPQYHGKGRSLVYTDFGADLKEYLTEIGYNVTFDKMSHEHQDVQKNVTFVTQKPS